MTAERWRLRLTEERCASSDPRLLRPKAIISKLQNHEQGQSVSKGRFEVLLQAINEVELAIEQGSLDLATQQLDDAAGLMSQHEELVDFAPD